MMKARTRRTRAGWLLALPIMLSATAMGQPLLTPIGTHEYWTAYELRDGDLRLCYAETPLVDWPVPHERLAGTVLMVTHDSMGFGGEMVRLRMGPAFLQEEFDSDEFRVTFDQQQAGYRHDFDSRDDRWASGYDDVVREIQNSASVGEPAIFWWHPQREALRQVAGLFSLDGFEGAYAAIREACPTAQDTTSLAPVYASDIRLEGEAPEFNDSMSEEEKDALAPAWLSQGPYLEFDVVGGSLFGSEEVERLTVRAVLNQNYSDSYGHGRQRIISMANRRPLDDLDFWLSYKTTRRMDYFRNGELFYSDHSPDIGWLRYGFEGVCRAPDRRLNLFFRGWGGGASQGEENVVAVYDPEQGLAWKSIKGSHDTNLSMARRADCGPNQSFWKWGDTFTPCVCGGWQRDDTYTEAQNTLQAELWSTGDESARIDAARLSEWKAQLATLEPFLLWDDRAEFFVHDFESPEFEVASLSFIDRSSTLSTVQSVFARRRDEDWWLRIFESQPSSQWWDFVTVYGFAQAHVLERSRGRYEYDNDAVMAIDLNEHFSQADAASVEGN